MMSEASSLSVYAVLILAGIVLSQTIFIALVTLRLLRRLTRLEPKLARALSKTADAAARGEELLIRLQDVKGEFPRWQENFSRWAEVINGALVEIDGAAKRWLSAAREHSHEADRKTDRLLLQFSEKAAQVQRSVSSPAHHISAAVKAMRAALTRYFSSRNEHTPYHFHADRDDFI